jgi:hypothetical protein
MIECCNVEYASRTKYISYYAITGIVMAYLNAIIREYDVRMGLNVYMVLEK